LVVAFAWPQRSVRGSVARYRVRGDSVGDAPVSEVSMAFVLGALVRTVSGRVLPLETVMNRRFAVGPSRKFSMSTAHVAYRSALSA
jgi:hypothetical protein